MKHRLTGIAAMLALLSAVYAVTRILPAPYQTISPDALAGRTDYIITERHEVTGACFFVKYDPSGTLTGQWVTLDRNVLPPLGPDGDPAIWNSLQYVCFGSPKPSRTPEGETAFHVTDSFVLKTEK